MSICLPAYVREYACAMHLSVCVCYVSVCMNVIHLSILMCMCVQVCVKNLWMFLVNPLPHPPPPIFGDFLEQKGKESINHACMVTEHRE